MTNSKLICKQCRIYHPAESIIRHPIGKFCSDDCVMALIKAKQESDTKQKLAKAKAGIKVKEKAARAKHKADKEKLKTKSDWMKEAQAAFNKWIRLRDLLWFKVNSLPVVCTSCQKPPKKINAGHYRSVGGNPELRFEPLNNNLQCEYCNTHLSGNLIDYRINLIKKIGQDKVDWLEGPHEPKNYTIDDIKTIKKEYTKKARELDKELNDV